MRKLFTCTLLLCLCFLAVDTSALAADTAVVRAVLFYSPSCGHCHLVITETLPPLVEKYGEQLYIVGVDISQAGGQALFLEAIEYFGLESAGVPFLVIGDVYLIGSVDIPTQLPVLIEHYLAEGGVDWPTIPGFAEAMQAAEDAQAATPTAQAESTPPATTPEMQPAATEEGAIPPTPVAPVITPTAAAGLVLPTDIHLTPWERVALDPQGNGLAIVVLVGMLISAVAGAIYLRKAPPKRSKRQTWDWLIPMLCILGLGVAGYLSYVETAHVEAVCGPVGDCNTVQQSQYARLFGILPIGVLGLVGYVLILIAWGGTRLGNPQQAAYAWLAMLGMTTFGLLFSIYLTFLEPFVIGATCAWCVTSAVIMTALFWLSLAPARRHFDLALRLVKPRR